MTEQEFQELIKSKYPSARHLGGGVVAFSTEDHARLMADPDWQARYEA